MPVAKLQENVVMPASDQGKAPAYKVKRVEPVMRGSDVQARLFTLAPGEAIPWHYHLQSTDHYFVLEGVLSISTREPDVMRTVRGSNPRAGSSRSPG
jgi:quercetin dioxygenase-like cupin family protein